MSIIKGVQAKPKEGITKKTCDIYITNERIICVVLGQSTFINAMIGNAVAGAMGMVAFSLDANAAADSKRTKNQGKALDEMIQKNPGSYDIKFDQVDEAKSNFKTGFFSTLGIWAPLTVKTYAGKRFFFDIPNKEKDKVKNIIQSATNKIKVS